MGRLCICLADSKNEVDIAMKWLAQNHRSWGIPIHVRSTRALYRTRLQVRDYSEEKDTRQCLQYVFHRSALVLNKELPCSSFWLALCSLHLQDVMGSNIFKSNQLFSHWLPLPPVCLSWFSVVFSGVQAHLKRSPRWVSLAAPHIPIVRLFLSHLAVVTVLGDETLLRSLRLWLHVRWDPQHVSGLC